jgi:hypothetical protein
MVNISWPLFTCDSKKWAMTKTIPWMMGPRLLHRWQFFVLCDVKISALRRQVSLVSLTISNIKLVLKQWHLAAECSNLSFLRPTPLTSHETQKPPRYLTLLPTGPTVVISFRQPPDIFYPSIFCGIAINSWELCADFYRFCNNSNHVNIFWDLHPCNGKVKRIYTLFI